MATLAMILKEEIGLAVMDLALFSLFQGSRLRSPVAQKDRQLEGENSNILRNLAIRHGALDR